LSNVDKNNQNNEKCRQLSCLLTCNWT